MARSSLPRQIRNPGGGSGSPGTALARRPQTAPRTPEPVRQSLTRHGMDTSGSFGPGAPMNPYFGYSQRTRAMDYPVGVNISTRSRASWGRVSFDVLKQLIDAYDVARMCINHKIDEIRSMPLMFQPADSVDDDVDEAIDVAKLILSYPDRELPYESWVSKWLENALKYDSAPLYRRRNYDGDIIALEVVDGKTINPYIDENGRRPRAPAPAFYQTVHGMVADWLTAEDIIYVPFRPQEDSPFGLAPIESILLTANTDLRFQWHFLQLFTDGSVPAGFMEVPPDLSSPDQVAEWQDYWDAMVMGDQAKLHQLVAVPSGSNFVETKPKAFDATFPEYLMMRTCAAYGVVPQDLGLIKDVNRANGETQVDIQFRINTLPWVRYVEGILTRYIQHDIGLPVKVRLDTGRDKEDRLVEAQAHKLYVDMGAESPDEVRVDVLGKAVDKERPTPRFYAGARQGPITLWAIEGAAGKTDPDTYGPAKDQPALDQPYVPPIPVVAAAGTTDDKASLAATNAYQVQARRALEGQGTPNRETAEQRQQRGARQAPQTGAALLTPAPQGSQAEQDADDQDDPAAAVAKGAVMSGAEAGELSAFRVFAKTARRRGVWERDFVFTAVAPAVGAELNRAGRAELAAIAKATADPDGTAQAVYDQLAENFPPEAIAWVKGVRWTGPQDVPLEEVDFGDEDSWAASHEPGRVDKTVRKIRAGKPVKPAVLIARPGGDTPAMVADGHHRAKAAKRANVPLRAYVAHPAKAAGPWDEMHSSQQVRKAADAPDDGLGPKMAGLAVRAADTGRVLMIQRGQDPADPAAGFWEFPGGHREAGEQPPAAAAREWQEEVGRLLPPGRQTGTWTTPNGAYAGHVWTVPSEDDVRVDGPRDRTLNPDDPGRDHVEAIAWWDPEQLPGNPAVRAELAADLDTVLPQLTGDDAVAKAAGSPKAPAPERGLHTAKQWPGWDRDLNLAAVYRGRIRQALTGAVNAAVLADEWLHGHRVAKAAYDDDTAATRRWLTDQGAAGAVDDALLAVLGDAATEGYALGGLSAQALVSGNAVDWGDWHPGDPAAAARVLGADGLGAGLQQLLDDSGITIKSVGEGRMDALAQALAGALETGESADSLARTLRGVLDDDRWAYMVAVTETNRAVSAATLDVYGTAGIPGKEWLIAGDQRVCPTCELNAGDGPIALATAFTSGDNAPPAHPLCRCAVGPADLPGGDRD